jgi:flagellar biosynthesis/type III secretory pathway chaperone
MLGEMFKKLGNLLDSLSEEIDKSFEDIKSTDISSIKIVEVNGKKKVIIDGIEYIQKNKDE